MDGVKVIDIENVPKNMNGTMVLVCVDEKHFKDIGELLMNHGFYKIYYVGNNPWDELQ